MTKKTTIHLPVETKLTITPDAFASGLLFSQTEPGVQPVFVSAIAASTAIELGPFDDALTYIAEMSSGDITVTKAFEGSPASGGITASSTDTFTNKTIDANGTGNSITNIDVADLATGTDGELITWDAAGAPATVAVGTATHVLTSNGIGAAPTFQTAAGGGSDGWVLLSTQTASTSTQLDFTSVITSSYNQYVFVIDNILGSADVGHIRVRTSTDNGATFDSASNDYEYNNQRIVISGTSVTYASDTTTATEYRTMAGSHFLSTKLSGFIYLHAPLDAATTGISHRYISAPNGGSAQRFEGHGTRKAAADVDAVRIFTDAGTFVSGTIRLYGIANT